MTIYVDDAEIFARVWNPSSQRYIEGIWHHLFSDQLDPEELHQFASRLGLRRAWFQRGSVGIRPAPWKDHYDVVQSKKARAIRQGARPITKEEAVDIWRAKRDKYLRVMGM